MKNNSENSLPPSIKQELNLAREERKLLKDDLTHRWEAMTEEQLKWLYEEVQDLNDYIHRLVTGKITQLPT